MKLPTEGRGACALRSACACESACALSACAVGSALLLGQGAHGVRLSPELDGSLSSSETSLTGV